MKYVLIDKSETESFVELPDGRIVSIPLYSTYNYSNEASVNTSVNNSTENLHNTTSYIKNNFDFF